MFKFLWKNNIKSKMTGFRNFEFTSFLSPWYFKDNIPFLGGNLKWKYFDKIVITKLFDNKNCVGLIDTYCYLKPINSEQFLIWVRGTTKIELYRIKDLQPIDNDEEVIKELKKRKEKYFFNCEPIGKIEYFFDLFQTEIDFDFPDSFKDIDEIIQVNDMTGMYEDFKQGEMGNTGIVALNPRESKITLFPQDWFNLDKTVDFGYQWITRADRNKSNGKIQIQGIRIGEFILDKTNRQLER